MEVRDLRTVRSLIGVFAAFSLVGVLASCGAKGPEKINPAAKKLTLTRCGAIFENTSQLTCFEKHFETVRQTEGVEAALDQLVEWHLDPQGGPFSQHCHEVLHQLGVNEMREARGESERVSVFTKSRVTCTGGFVHGALTEYYREIDATELEKTYQNLCTDLVKNVSDTIGRDSDSTGWLSWNCNHMLGHAIYTQNPDNLTEAANMCGNFEKDSDQRLGCEAGFYMEHYLTMGRTPGEPGSYTASQSISDVHKLCRDVAPEVARGCWSESGGMVYIQSGRDWTAAGESCRQETKDVEFLEACYESLGRNIAPYAGYEPDQMAEWCSLIGDQFAVEVCTIQTAGSQAMELDNVESGVSLCNKMIKDPERLNRCIQGVKKTGDQLAGSGFEGGVGTWDR